MMIALEQARAHLDQLGLTQAAEIMESRLTAAAQKEMSYVEFLADLLSVEVAARRQRYLTARTRLAHFPFLKTLEESDFGFQPSIDERQVRELAALAFVSDAANVILMGPPGVGKTHLAVALGLKAIENGHGVLCESSRSAGGSPKGAGRASSGPSYAGIPGTQSPDHR